MSLGHWKVEEDFATQIQIVSRGFAARSLGIWRSAGLASQFTQVKGHVAPTVIVMFGDAVAIDAGKVPQGLVVIIAPIESATAQSA